MAEGPSSLGDLPSCIHAGQGSASAAGTQDGTPCNAQGRLRLET